MNDGTKRLAIVGAVIVILLLLWKSGVRGVALPASISRGLAPAVNVSTTQYVLPGLQIPSLGGAWDWMQTTDLECGCDAGGTTFDPTRFETTPGVPKALPSYTYVKPAPVGAGSYYYPQPTHFDTYQAPPPLKWHWEYGWSVTNPEERSYPVGEDGVVFLTGKYARRTDFAGSYPFQTKDVVWQGTDIISQGKKYVHDADADQKRPKSFHEGQRDSENRIMGGWDVSNQVYSSFTVAG